MRAPYIPDGVLGMTRMLTASESSIYNINCGAAGSWNKGQGGTFKSAFPELAKYNFTMKSCGMDSRGLYEITITKDTAGGRRKTRTRRNRRT